MVYRHHSIINKGLPEKKKNSCKQYNYAAGYFEQIMEAAPNCSYRAAFALTQTQKSGTRNREWTNLLSSRVEPYRLTDLGD